MQNTKQGARVTVNLSPASTDDLQEIVELAGGTKTEAINKALQLYAEVKRLQTVGGGAWIQGSASELPVKTLLY